MIFFAVTKPRKKASAIFKVLLAVFALGVLLPSLYGLMTDANSLERFAAKEKYPGEPIRVEAPVDSINELAVWKEIETIYSIR